MTARMEIAGKSPRRNGQWNRQGFSLSAHAQPRTKPGGARLLQWTERTLVPLNGVKRLATGEHRVYACGNAFEKEGLHENFQNHRRS